MKILIKNGLIVNENQIFESDILVNGELIEKIENIIINKKRNNRKCAPKKNNQSRWGRRNPSAVFCMGPLNCDQSDCAH